jgi:hypothetical protein
MKKARIINEKNMKIFYLVTMNRVNNCMFTKRTDTCKEFKKRNMKCIVMSLVI